MDATIDSIDCKVARLARRWGMFPPASDSDVVGALGDTLWFAQVRVNVAMAILMRPITRPMTRMLRRFA